MKTSKWMTIGGAVVLASALGACGTMDRQTAGTAGGAALGGMAGHAATGSTVGTIGGAAAGGVIGHEVTRPRH